MGDKRVSTGQDLIWRLEAVGFDVFTFLFRLLPVDAASWLGGAIARLIGPLTKTHKVADDNLRLAFPEKDAAWRGRILDAQWETNGRTVAEFPMMDRLLPSTGRVEVVNAGRLTEIARGGKPVVFVSGHFSNWEVMPAAIVNSGVDCEITYRAANNPYVDKRIRDSRFRYGVRLFAPKGGDGAREMLEGMKQGRSVALMKRPEIQPRRGRRALLWPTGDGRAGPDAAGPAVRHGAAALSVVRLPGVRFRVTAHEPIEIAPTGDRAADIQRGVQAITSFIEERVREHPVDWFWVHKRWPDAVYAALESESSRG